MNTTHEVTRVARLSLLLLCTVRAWHADGGLFDARVNGGRLLVTSLDLATDLDANIVARQFRASLLRYMKSERFAPAVTVSPEQIRGMMK